MRENLIIILRTVTHGTLQKIMLKFFFLFNSIIRPPVPLPYSHHQQVTLANKKMLTEVQKTNILLNKFLKRKQEKQASC